MSLARTYPSLRTRIVQQQAWTIPADIGGVTRPKPIASYTERYRGTEFASPVGPPMARRAKPDTRGRNFVLLWGTAIVSVAGVVLVAMPAWG